MVSNYIVRERHRAVQEKIRELGAKRKEIQKIFSSLGLTNNQKKKPGLLDDRTALVRERALQQLNKLEEEVAELQLERKRLADQWDTAKNGSLLRLFREIMTQDHITKISKEAERRALGEPETGFDLNFKRYDEYKTDFYKYRELAKEQVEKMVQFRIVLTRLIDSGCKEFGEAEFLKLISPLNQLIIPLKELEAIKRKHLL